MSFISRHWKVACNVEKYLTTLNVFQGGMSSGYKDHIAQKGIKDETYAGDGAALFRISGTSQHSSKAIQVDTVCSLLDIISFYLHSLVS